MKISIINNQIGMSNSREFTFDESSYLGKLSSFQANQVQSSKQPVRSYTDLREVFDLMDTGFTLGEAKRIAYNNHLSRRSLRRI